jgi:integrase
MTVPVVLDSAGRRRSPATLPGYHGGGPPRNKGQLYPANPPTVEEIVAVMRLTGERLHGWRLRALIVVLWRGGLRIHEALALTEHDLDPRRGSLLVRDGKGGKRREIGMDEWGWEQLRPWLAARPELPAGPLFCIIAQTLDSHSAGVGLPRPTPPVHRPPVSGGSYSVSRATRRQFGYDLHRLLPRLGGGPPLPQSRRRERVRGTRLVHPPRHGRGGDGRGRRLSRPS